MNEILEEEEEENELDGMKRILMGEIRHLNHPDRIKRHFQLYFGIPYESPEKLQLDQLLLNHKDQHKETKELIEEVRKEAARERKWLKAYIIALAVASGFIGLASEELVSAFIRGMGGF